MSPFQFECLELYSQTPTEVFGRFVFKPLEKGYGITIGNILRRVILTNLSGLSIVGVRILGINNEFSVLEGVREDVLEILLNLKEIIFKSKEYKQSSFIGRLKVYGPSIVTASNLQLPHYIKVINPNQYIATVMEKGIFEMEIKLEWGKGYALTSNNNIQDSFDFLSVDAIFMPVLKVNYEVEPLFIGHQEIGEKLVLDLWTNGSISPQEAIFKASISIANLFNQFCQENIFINFDKKKISNKQTKISKKNKQTKISKKIKQTKKISIATLNLSTRLFNYLRKINIKFIDDLLRYSQKDLVKIKGIGPKSLKEIITKFQENFNISFK